MFHNLHIINFRVQIYIIVKTVLVPALIRRSSVREKRPELLAVMVNLLTDVGFVFLKRTL